MKLDKKNVIKSDKKYFWRRKKLFLHLMLFIKLGSSKEARHTKSKIHK